MLASRVIVYPSDFAGALRFFDDILGLHRFREYGVDGRVTGVVYFLGGGYLEVAGGGQPPGGRTPAGARLWLQVRDVDAEHARLAAAGAEGLGEPAVMPWGLREMDVTGPDGLAIRVVEVPEDHPMRRRL